MTMHLSLDELKRQFQDDLRVERIEQHGDIYKLITTFNTFWLGTSYQIGLVDVNHPHAQSVVLVDAKNEIGYFVHQQVLETPAYEMTLEETVLDEVCHDTHRDPIYLQYSFGVNHHGQGTLVVEIDDLKRLGSIVDVFDNVLLGLRTQIVLHTGDDAFNLAGDPILDEDGTLFSNKFDA